jgi:ABC-type uncharacterized transport system ATPase subunit
MKIEIDVTEDDMIRALSAFRFDELAKLKRWVDAEYEQRLKRMDGYLPEERALPTMLARVKAIRDRLGVNLVTAKELAER